MKQAWISILPSSIRKSINKNTKLQDIITNTGWLFFDKIIRVVGALTVGVWLARYLGPQQYGSLNFAMAFVALFGAISTLGVHSIAVRSIVQKPESKEAILGAAFFLRLCGGTAAFTIILISIYIFRPGDSQSHLLVAILATGMLFSPFETIDLWFQSQVASKYSVIAKNSAFMLQLAVKIYLILANASVVAFALVMLMETIVAAIGLIVAYHANHQAMRGWQLHLPTVASLLRESWPLILSGLAYMVYMRIDQVMLGQILGDKEVGIYSAALRFSEAWYFVPYAIVSSLMPNLTEAKMASESEYYEKLQKLFNVLVRTAYLVALATTFMANPLMIFFCGAEYASGGIILSIHIWTAVFVFIGVGSTPWIINEGLSKLLLLQALAGAILNIIFNYLLIPEYGGMGAAVATLLAQSVSAFVINSFFSTSRKLFFMQARSLCRFGC